MKQSHASSDHRPIRPSQGPSVPIEETRRFAERRILGALRWRGRDGVWAIWLTNNNWKSKTWWSLRLSA